ncbi:MAG: zf-HC2 domain-containing protein [Actinomycetota bacterium]
MSGIDCAEALARIERYLDGELEAEATVEVHAHVEGCSPCADRAALGRRLKERLRDACGGCDVPPELAERLRNALDAAGD